MRTEFSAERVTSSPPELGGEPEGRGGLKKRQFYGIASISPRSCVPSVASGKAERRPLLGNDGAHTTGHHRIMKKRRLTTTEKASRKARFFLIVTEAGSIFGSH